jgi:hypothetical protein
MLDYRLSFDIDVKNGEGIEVLIISREDVPAWKKNNRSSSVNCDEVKTVEVTFHNWQQEIKEIDNRIKVGFLTDSQPHTGI